MEKRYKIMDVERGLTAVVLAYQLGSAMLIARDELNCPMHLLKVIETVIVGS